MKTPRVTDFDPNATPPPSLGSPMDNFPSIIKPRTHVASHSPLETPHPRSQSPKANEPVRPVRDVPPALSPIPQKRMMKPRHPFDIYQDQYDTLRILADEERRQGGAGSMSAMVREALDTFIADKRRKNK